MNLFKLIGTGVSTLFGGSKDTGDIVKSVVTGVGGWIDEQKFTDEERAVMVLKIGDAYSKFLASTVDENSERSKTRRNIAIWVIRVEAFFLMVSLATVKVDPSLSEYAYKIAVDSPWGLLTLGVGAFFFGSHMLRGTSLKDKNS